MAVLTILLTVILVTISILIVLIVLLQRPKQEGLGAAFGGSTLDGALGAQTTDVLQKGTTIFAVIFFVCSIGLAMIKSREFGDAAEKGVLDGLEKPEPILPESGNPLPIDPNFVPPPTLPLDTPPLGIDDGSKEKSTGDNKAGAPDATDATDANGEKGKAPAPGAKSVEDAKASDQPDPAPKAEKAGKSEKGEKGKAE